MSGRKTAASVVILTSAMLLAGIPAGISGTIIDEHQAAADVQAAAADLYGSGGAAYPGNDTAFQEAFPGYELYYWVGAERVPPVTHAMAYDPDSDTGYDLTDDFNQLVGVISSSDRALELAETFAQVGNSELDVGREVVNESDEAWLGAPQVEDPQVTTLIDGWEVQLWTWSAENGILSKWYVDLGVTGLLEADRFINTVGVGPFEAELYAPNIDADMEFYNTWDSGHDLEGWVVRDGTYHEMTIHETGVPVGTPCPAMYDDQAGTEVREANFDISDWVACDLGGEGSPSQGAVDAAQALAEGGVLVYGDVIVEAPRTPGTIYPECGQFENPDPNWGFESNETDCRLDLRVANETTLLCWVCVDGGSEVEITISPLFKDHLNALGYYTDASKHNLSEVAHSVMANAFTRYLTYNNATWTPAIPALQDGIPRMAQLVLNPDAEHDETSLFVGEGMSHADPRELDGAADYQVDPGAGFCQWDVWDNRQADSFALYWAWVHERAGINVFKTLLDAMSTRDGEVCDPAAVNGTMADGYAACAPIAYYECSLPDSWTRYFGHGGQYWGDAWVNSLAEFSVDMYLRNFTWEIDGQTWDMGQYLPNATRDLVIGDEVILGMAPYTIQFVEELDPGEASSASCASEGVEEGDLVSLWAATVIVQHSDGSVSTDRIPCDGSSFSLPDHELAAVAVVRGNHEESWQASVLIL